MNQALLLSKNMSWCTPQNFFDRLIDHSADVGKVKTRQERFLEMFPRAEDCIRHEIHENGVGDRWNGCQGTSIACPGVKKCPFYIGLETPTNGERIQEDENG